MNLNGKNRSALWMILLLAAVNGSLFWEVVERSLAQLGVELSLAVGPVGIDLSVISVRLLVNPGTFIGLLAGVYLFRSL